MLKNVCVMGYVMQKCKKLCYAKSIAVHCSEVEAVVGQVMILNLLDWTNTGFSLILLTVDMFLIEHGLYIVVTIISLRMKICLRCVLDFCFHGCRASFCLFVCLI